MSSTVANREKSNAVCRDPVPHAPVRSGALCSLPGGGVSTIPSQAELTAAVGRTFTLASAQAPVVEARLAAVWDETPMDDGFLCYSAHLELPAGVWLPQDTYRVSAPDGAAWDLLVTPTRPAANGATTMCFVIHSAKPSSSDDTPNLPHRGLS
jgi:hypothetical protein